MTLYLPFKTASKLMKGFTIKTNKKASYNIGNSSNNVSINVGKYTSLVESWIDQQPFVDTNNKHISKNNGSFHRSNSFIYIPSSGNSLACIQLQENDYEKDEQCNVPARQGEISLKQRYGLDKLLEMSSMYPEVNQIVITNEHNHHVNDLNSTRQSIGEHVETYAF